MAKTASLLAATLAALCLCQSPCFALSSRAWVSGHGTDAVGCGSPASPCRSLQYAHDNIIAAGGEIDILDPAGYGAVTISKAISIVNDGVGTAGVQQGASGQNAITINAGASDVVTLRGLNIDGLGTGANGIVFNTGGGLTIVNCVIRHFAGNGVTTGNGVLIQPASGSMRFLVSEVIASDNGYAGVDFAPPSGTPNATGVIDRVTAVNNSYGLAINSTNAGGGAAAIAISNSIASTNSSAGIFVGTTSAALTATIDNSSATGNGDYGLYAENAAIILLGRSVITSNNYGVFNSTSSNTLYSYGDNRINSNQTKDVHGGLNTADAPQ